jgi:amino acid transporter
MFHGASIAVLTYIGFDGISTMSEEVENPRRNILLDTVLTCFAIGVLSAIEVYLAQLVGPGRTPFPLSMVDTSFVEVAHRVGGSFLFQLLNATLTRDRPVATSLSTRQTPQTSEIPLSFRRPPRKAATLHECGG